MNEKKPINVLAEYLTDWIHRNSDESAPFDSFEAIRGKTVEQKDVERWIFNCNYLYYRFGNYLFNDVGFRTVYDKDTPRLLAFLSENFKSIKDSNPLNLRSKQDQAVISEFLKDWPPFMKTSRNRINRLEQSLRQFCADFADTNGKVNAVADSFLEEMKQEAAFYEGFARGEKQGSSSAIWCCKELVPLWCIKEINPLYTLLIWEDEAAISELSELLKEAFLCNGYPAADGSYHCESYIQAVKRAQSTYLEAYMSTTNVIEATGLGVDSIPEIYAILSAAGFSLERPCSSPNVPSSLFGKAQLIWNIVGCAIFGPKEVVSVTESERTYTRPRASLYRESIDEEREGMRGEVILRRLYQDRGPEMAGRLVIDDVQNDCLWKVIGGYYDRNAALPSSTFRTQYEDLRGAFIATQGYDEAGDVTEGDGDSRYHAELSVRLDEDGRRRLVLVDLGSKNGTYVIRRQGDALRYYVLVSGGNTRADEWAAFHNVDTSDVELVDELVLLRGDLVHLCGSCFEIV